MIPNLNLPDAAAAAATPHSHGSTQHHQQQQNNSAMELIKSVMRSDEEDRSPQHILTFAAQRYASAIERNPEDYDALYNWALAPLSLLLSLSLPSSLLSFLTPFWKVQIMLVRIQILLLKMFCLKRRAKSMTRPRVCGLHFMMRIIIGPEQFLIEQKCVVVQRKLKNYGSRSNISLLLLCPLCLSITVLISYGLKIVRYIISYVTSGFGNLIVMIKRFGFQRKHLGTKMIHDNNGGTRGVRQQKTMSKLSILIGTVPRHSTTGDLLCRYSVQFFLYEKN